jgi:hypothetical protein
VNLNTSPTLAQNNLHPDPLNGCTFHYGECQKPHLVLHFYYDWGTACMGGAERKGEGKAHSFRSCSTEAEAHQHVFEVAAHEDVIGGLHRNVRAGAHSNADVCLSQRGGVVHAIAHHGHHLALPLQLLQCSKQS